MNFLKNTSKTLNQSNKVKIFKTLFKIFFKGAITNKIKLMISKDTLKTNKTFSFSEKYK